MRNATRTTVAAFGTLAAIAGIEHGIGEILQGSRPPDSVMFLSWPDSPFFATLSGEPAMSLIPNLLISGILSILLSLVFLGWVLLYAQKKRGGLVMLGLSVLMLLVGAGFGPPLLGIILGLTATRINAPKRWWRERAPAGLRRFFAALWPWAFGAGLVAWLLLFPGWPMISYVTGVDSPTITTVVIAAAFSLLLLTIVSGFAYDAQQKLPRRVPALA